MCWAVGVLGKERNKLGRQRARRRQVRRHRGEQRVALRYEGSDARGHRDTTSLEVGHGLCDGLAETVEIEESLYIRTREDEHRAMLGGGNFFLVAAHNDRTESDPLAEDLGADDETGEDEQNAEKLSQEERPGHPEAVQAAGHAGNEAAKRDEERRRHARVQLAASQRERRAGQ